MKFEGTFLYMGNHGIVFNVSQITLTDSERGRLRELHFGERKAPTMWSTARSSRCTTRCWPKTCRA